LPEDHQAEEQRDGFFKCGHHVQPPLLAIVMRLAADSRYEVHIPKGLDLAAVAPLLCAGITTYSPLKRFGCKKGDKVAVVGLGGLGHMAVKLAASMGAEVTMLSTSLSKEADARRLGASGFAITRDDRTFEKLAGRLVRVFSRPPLSVARKAAMALSKRR